MSIFIDMGPLVAYHNVRDAKQERADALLTAVMRGEYGGAITSDYVFDEAVTLAYVRTKSLDVALAVGEFVLPDAPEERIMTLLPITNHIFRTAWRRFQEQGDRRLSFTDWTSLVLMEVHGIDALLSFDRGFDGLVGRVA